jgi:hypothetical protein
VLAFQSTLTDGKYAVAFININTRSAEKVRFQPQKRLSGTLQTRSYSAARQNPDNSRIITGTISGAATDYGIMLPAESVVVLETQ